MYFLLFSIFLRVLFSYTFSSQNQKFKFEHNYSQDIYEYFVWEKWYFVFTVKPLVDFLMSWKFSVNLNINTGFTC